VKVLQWAWEVAALHMTSSRMGEKCHQARHCTRDPPSCFTAAAATRRRHLLGQFVYVPPECGDFAPRVGGWGTSRESFRPFTALRERRDDRKAVSHADYVGVRSGRAGVHSALLVTPL
jgi:hypothetical protein